jgi:predicted Zn-dependent peptidase
MQPDEKRDRVYLCAVAPAPSAQADERYAADVLTEVLGGGEGSRLYWALVHPGIADSADMMYSEEDGAGSLYVFATCDPERTTEVIDLIRATLNTAQSDGISDDEIARARRKLASALVLRAETPMGRLITVGLDYVYRKRIEPLTTTVDKYLAVQSSDVDTLLQNKPFDKLTLVGYGPLTAAS